MSREPLRLLLVYYYFPPRGGVAVQRVVKLIKYLAEHDVEVAVVTSSGDYERLRDETLASELPPSCRVHRTSEDTRAIEGQFRRSRSVDAFASWVQPAIQLAREVIAQWSPDVLLTTSPPHSQQQIGLSLSKVLPWVVDFRDPWTHDPRWRLRAGRLARVRNERLEQATLRRAQAIVATTPTTTKQFEASARAAGSAARCVCIPNGWDAADLPSASPVQGERFVLSYVGSVGFEHNSSDPTPVLSAVARLAEAGRVRPETFGLRFIGSESQVLRRRIEDFGLTGLVWAEGHRPHAEAVRAMAESHGLLLVQRPVGGAHLEVIPAKLFEYMAARRPILAACSEGDTADIVRDHRLGLVADPEDANAVAEAISKMVSSHNPEPMPPPPAEYDRRRQAAAYAELLREVSMSQRPRPNPIRRIQRAVTRRVDTDALRRAWNYQSQSVLNAVSPPTGLRLHLGCGRVRLEGFTNIDHRATEATDLVCDVRRLPFPNGAAERIESYHVIEHLPHREVPAMLQEWRRVLAPGGALVIECPDFDGTVREYLEGNKDRIYNIYGLQRFPGDFHLFGYDEARLERVLRDAGFTDVRFTEPQDYHKDEEPCLRAEAVAG